MLKEAIAEIPDYVTNNAGRIQLVVDIRPCVFGRGSHDDDAARKKRGAYRCHEKGLPSAHPAA